MNSPISFITGGEGFIGSHLCRVLLDRGHRVHILSRKKNIGWRLSGLENDLCAHRGDITQASRLNSLITRIHPNFVFHLAALTDVRRDPSLMTEMLRVNLQGTENLLKACEGKIRRFIHVGTCEEYGDSRAPFKESDRESPVSPYSWSKAAATQLALMWHRSRKFPVVVARPFLTYGPLQKNNMFIPTLIRSCLLKKEFKMTRGLQTREFNYVSDIANGLADLATAQGLEGEIINLGTGREEKIRDVAKLIHEFCGSQGKLKMGAIPYRAGEAMRFYSSTAKARKLLSWRPETTLETGLWATIDWTRTHLGRKIR